MGKYITSKRHYQEEMKKGGFVSFEEGERLANEPKTKPYVLSKKAVDLIKSARQSADSKGRIKPGSRLIDGMKDVGVNFNAKIPNSLKGGFDAV